MGARADAKRRRGAAMVEALIVAAAFTVLCSVLIFLATLYASKLASQTDARAAVWTYALGSCEQGRVESDGTNLGEVLDDPQNEEEAELSQEARDLTDEAGRTENVELELGESWGMAEASASRPAPARGSFAGGQLTTTMRVQCDETPRGANPVDVLRFVWDLRTTGAGLLR